MAWDKAQHFTAYFGLATMATMVLGLNRRLALAILGVILLGGALEILQGYTGRDPDIFDFWPNAVGALRGTVVAALSCAGAGRRACLLAAPSSRLAFQSRFAIQAGIACSRNSRNLRCAAM